MEDKVKDIGFLKGFLQRLKNNRWLSTSTDGYCDMAVIISGSMSNKCDNCHYCSLNDESIQVRKFIRNCAFLIDYAECKVR